MFNGNDAGASDNDAILFDDTAAKIHNSLGQNRLATIQYSQSPIFSQCSKNEAFGSLV